MFTKNLLRLIRPVQVTLFACVAILLCLVGQTRISHEEPADFFAGVDLEEEVFELPEFDEYRAIDPDAFPDDMTDLLDAETRLPMFFQEPILLPDDLGQMVTPQKPLLENALTFAVSEAEPFREFWYPKEKKRLLLKMGVGTNESEAAVARGLAWLANQQISIDDKTGYWEFDGVQKDWRIAATGLAILPFLAMGETHIPRPKKPRKPDLEGVPEMPTYDKNIARGLAYLLSRQKTNGGIVGIDGKVNMVEHGIATLALCELTGMVGDKDPILRDAAILAVEFIVKAQAKDGSWGHRPNENGDTLTLAWQIQALKSADISGLKITGVKTATKKAEVFLESMMTNTASEFNFGFDKQGNGSDACTAAGILCRMYLGWKPSTPALMNGIKHLKQNTPTGSNVDLLTQYYATQVMFFYGGPDWHKGWNPAMQRAFLRARIYEEPNRGSWPPKFDELGGEAGIGKQYGRLGTTCFSLLTISVNLGRHLPLYQVENLDKNSFQD